MLDRVPEGIDKDNHFLSLAFLASCRSKDPRTKVGAVAVMDDLTYYTGYNGCPRGFNDALLSGEDKYSLVIHAEENALDLAGKERCRQQKNLQLYVTFRPCPSCAIKLLDFNVKRVIYYSEYKSGTNDFRLLELIRRKGYTNNEPEFSLEKYEGQLLFCHSHMGK